MYLLPTVVGGLDVVGLKAQVAQALAPRLAGHGVEEPRRLDPPALLEVVHHPVGADAVLLAHGGEALPAPGRAGEIDLFAAALGLGAERGALGLLERVGLAELNAVLARAVAERNGNGKRVRNVLGAVVPHKGDNVLFTLQTTTKGRKVRK